MARKKKLDRDTILGDLKTGIVQVKFEKLDGTERTMRATLRKDMIPSHLWPSEVNEDYNDRNENNECRVFDTEIGQWRAFTWSRLLDAKVA